MDAAQHYSLRWKPTPSGVGNGCRPAPLFTVEARAFGRGNGCLPVPLFAVEAHAFRRGEWMPLDTVLEPVQGRHSSAEVSRVETASGENEAVMSRYFRTGMEKTSVREIRVRHGECRTESLTFFLSPGQDCVPTCCRFATRQAARTSRAVAAAELSPALQPWEGTDETISRPARPYFFFPSCGPIPIFLSSFPSFLP